MHRVGGNNEIEDEIETFLDNVRKHGTTSGVTIPPETLEKLPENRKIFQNSSESSQVIIASISDESVTNTETTESNHINIQSTGTETGDSCSMYDEDTIFEDDSMEDVLCPISVQDVADMLHKQHTILTGGKSKDGCPIITFPDNNIFCNLGDDDYQKLMLYLTAIPSLQEADLGFVLVIDRRNDKWASVRTVLMKIGGFFPGLIQAVYVLRPAGFFQKAISEVSSKFFKEEFKFKVVICNSVEELHEFISPKELTKELQGSIVYDHKEWIEQRAAVENFSRHTREISQNLRQLVQRLQETELPNDVQSTREIRRVQTKEYHSLKDDIRTMTGNGEALLKLLRHPCTRSPSAISSCASSAHPCPESKLVNVTVVERLLVQLEETENGFDEFWSKHEDRLQQCLELRRFEHEFRELQSTLDASIKQLADLAELGDSVARVDALLQEMNDFKEDCKDDLDKASRLCRIGHQLIDSQHYAVDSIQPKCVELQRIRDDFHDRLQKRIDSLHKYRDLQERVELANQWCTRGVNLLAGQKLEKSTSPEFVRSALEEVDMFLLSSSECRLSDPKEFRNLFKDMITPETTALVQQVLRRIEDVQVMCERKKSSLQKLADRPSRPVQPVVPEPAVPLCSGSASPSTLMKASQNNKSLSSSGQLRMTEEDDDESDIYADAQVEGTKKCARQTRNLNKIPLSVSERGYSKNIDDADLETLRSKRKHVANELLDTERIYVMELKNILEGYIEELRNPAAHTLIPSHILGQEDILFGNIENIYQFHKDVFLRDLENCIEAHGLIGLCFIQRKEALHDLYTIYCQNKPKSEALRRDSGDDVPFFKECQKRLGHKLPLSAYLLKPIQRITKYQLLLKELLKYSHDGRERQELQEAVDCMLNVIRYVNDSMHQVAITGFAGCLSTFGRLLLQGSFNIWCERKNDRLKELRLKPMQRHLFLYQKAVLFCKKVSKFEDHPTYAFKRCLKMSQVGLTETIKASKGTESRKFELWTPGRTEVYVIEAPALGIKELWVKEVKEVLLEQFVNIKQHHSAKVQKFETLNGVGVLQNDVATTHM